MALTGKRVLITGSSRGIGRGIALKLAEEGARIAVHYYQNEAAAQDTLARIRELGSDGVVVQADVLNGDEFGRMFARVQEEFGGLDIFVSNARPELPEFFAGPMDISPDQWDAAFNSQAKAFLFGARAAAQAMPEGGRIVA